MKIILLLGLMVFGFSNVNFAQWTQTDGPYIPAGSLGPYHVDKIISNDSIIITSGYAGTFYRTNLSDPWTQLNLGLIEDYYITGDTLYVIEDGGGLYQTQFSTFNGEFTQISNWRIGYIDHNNGVLYNGTGGTSAMGFYWSGDNGATWTPHNDGIPGLFVQSDWEYVVYSVAHSDNYVFAGTWGGVHRNSTTLGTWEEKNNGLPLGYMPILEIYDDTLYATIGEVLYRSADFSESWTSFYAAPSDIQSLYKNGNDIYLGTELNGIQHSSNSGATWSSLNIGLTSNSILDVNEFKDTLVCGANTQGFSKYLNGTWSTDNAAQITQSVRSITSTSNGLFTNTENDVYQLAANDTWTLISMSAPYYLFHELKSSNDTIFLSTHESNSTFDNQYILYSLDLGVSWTEMINPFNANYYAYNIEYDNGTLYAHEGNDIHSTTDFGVTWTDIDIPAGYCTILRDFQVENDVAFTALCGYGEVLKLENGSNWVLSSSGLPQNGDAKFIAFCDGVAFTYFLGQGMYASFDDGNTWTYASSGLGTNKVISDYVSVGQQLFLTTNYGVYSTIDFGQNWYALNGGLTNLETTSIAFLNDTLYAGTSIGGIWKSAVQELNQTIGISENDFASFEIQLYPNPSNGKFTLQWPDETVKHLDIRILDAVGKEVYTTTHSENPIQFDVNLSPGIYYVSTNSIDNNEVILVKIE
ncbi:MAG: photosystem II stability/assembly factor-like uncharacterized protein [Salibacteraceae bacterium]|jgi:photosystem II stability/assembly factor-like uncharacterized protein